MNIVGSVARTLLACRRLAAFGQGDADMFTPAEDYGPYPLFALDPIQWLRLLLVDPFIRRTLALTILVLAAILARKLLGERKAMGGMDREEQLRG